MCRSPLVQLLAILAVFASGTPGTAALVSVDLNAPDDDLLTRDTVSNLEWLDLPVTAGLTYNEVISGVGGYTGLGFRHATASEVDAVLMQFGLQPNSDGSFNAGRAFQEFFGCTDYCSTGMRESLGIAEAVPFNPLNKISRNVVTDITGNPPYTSVGVSQVGVDTPVPHFLVRAHVPEPRSLLFLILTCSALSLTRSRDAELLPAMPQANDRRRRDQA